MKLKVHGTLLLLLLLLCVIYCTTPLVLGVAWPAVQQYTAAQSLGEVCIDFAYIPGIASTAVLASGYVRA